MGDLVRTPYSEVTATLEILDRWGVKPEHLDKFRRASSFVHSQVAQALISSREEFFAGTTKHLIDCDAPPFVPDGWSHHEEDQLPNRAKGIFTWDHARVKLYLSKKQRGDKYIVGNDLRKELATKPVLNANILDYLLKPENQHLIPEEWKGKAVFFWGTIYRNVYGDLYVRCLCWSGGEWRWRCHWLVHGFDSSDPAAVLAS